MRRLLVIVLYLLLVSTCWARTITVDDDGPADFRTIQAAIDDSNEGDEIIVSPGTYCENINFKGKNITLRSTDPNDPNIVSYTIIDGNNVDTVVTFTGTENETCILSGFTIQNGFQDNYRNGGGICGGSEENHTRATIQKNIIAQNFVTLEGGGLYNCDGLIEKNTITRNLAQWGGGLYGCNGIIRNNVITMNSASDGGGGLGWCNATIRNNTISGNSAEYGGGLRGCGGVIQNCIIWENTHEINKLCIDPLFADPNNGDYHLKSQAGRWDSKSKTWLQDDVTSACIDAGDPNTPIGLEPFPNGGRVNMGAYGGTVEASKSYFGKPVCETIVAGDINGDCRVDFRDFAIMVGNWLRQESAAGNQPPNVSIQQPKGGDTIGIYHQDDPIEIIADAYDVDGRVAKVEFYVDGSPSGVVIGKIGQDSDGSDGWEMKWIWWGNWGHYPEGDYILTAMAVDNNGAQTLSAKVLIHVHGPK